MNDYFVHNTAEVNPNARIGENTKIWNHAQVREESVIGANCNIGKNCYIDKDAIIGSNVKIANNVSVFHGVTIEDDVFVGTMVAFTNDLYPRAFSDEWELYETVVKKGASIGANSTIICGNTIGEYAMVGAGSVVTKNVKPHALVVGNPAKQVGWVCECGYKLNVDGICEKCGKKTILEPYL